MARKPVLEQKLVTIKEESQKDMASLTAMKLETLLKSIQDLNISKVVEFLETHPEGIRNGEDPDSVVNWIYDFKDKVVEELLKVKGKVEI